jgi:hypothetical protein
MDLLRLAPASENHYRRLVLSKTRHHGLDFRKISLIQSRRTFWDRTQVRDRLLRISCGAAESDAAQAIDERASRPPVGEKFPKLNFFTHIERYWVRCGPWRWDFLALCFACALLVADIAILASYNGLALAVSPFMQQIIHYRFRDVEQGAALLPVAYDYGPTGVGGFFAANLTMKAAAYAGIVSPLDSTFNMTSFCPSGNCTWPAFQTLGVCSSCTNLTDQIGRQALAPEYFEGGGPSNFYLPNGSNLTTQETLNSDGLTYMNVSTTARMYSQTYLTVEDFTFNNMSIAYADRGSLIIDILALRLRGLSNSGDNITVAHECMLQYCVKTISAVQRNGELVETEHDSWTNNGEAARKFYLGYLQTDPMAWIPLYFLQPPGQERVFRVGHAAQVQMTSWLSGQLSGTASRQPPNAGKFFGSDQIQGIDAAFDQDENGLQQVMANVASAMTTALRMNSSDTARGVGLVSETYISIQWAWLTLPLLLYVSAIGFVVAVAWRCGHTGDSKVNVWKNSLVAALFHGLDQEILAKIGHPDEQESIDEAAKDLKVKLTRDMHGLRLEGEEPHELREWQGGAHGIP